MAIGQKLTGLDLVPIVRGTEFVPSTFLNLKDGEVYRVHETLERPGIILRKVLLLAPQTVEEVGN